MNSRKILYSAIGIGCIVILILLYRFADPISAENVGLAYQVEQGVKAAIIAALTWIVWRFIALLWWEPWEERHGRPISRIVKDVVLVLVLFTAAIIVLACVYNKDPSGILKTFAGLGGVAGGVLGLSCGGIIKDCVSGLILDFTGGYKVGDWVRLPSGTNAQIRAIRLRETEFVLINGTSMTMGNDELLSKEVFNYSDSADGFWCDVRVSLDRSIPVDRARRLLQAAAAAAPGVLNKEAKVMAKEMSGGCVHYMVLYKIANFGQKSGALHGVIQSIMKNLQDHNLNIAGSATKTYPGNEELDTKILTLPQTSALDMLRLSPLFRSCNEEELESAAPLFSARVYRPGDIILAEKTRGSTMYFIAEGIVEISIQIENEPEEETSKKSRKKKTPENYIKKHITFLATNDFFGEGGVMNNAPRNATVSAHTDVVAYELTRDNLRQILQERPDMLLKISEAMVARRQETADIANQTKLSLQEQRRMTHDFANALKSFLGLD